MDALAQLEPVARDLLRTVDDTLATRGAPPDHPVWTLLRRIGLTAAGAVEFFAGLEPADLRGPADAVRGQAGGYLDADIPASIGWRGAAARSYADRASGLAGFLRGVGEGPEGGDSLVDRLRATADYLDAVAGWQRQSRDALARALAEVLTSGQAVALRTSGANATDTAWATPRATGAADLGVAAADITARLLAAAVDARDRGDDLHRAWAGRLTELSYVEPMAAAARVDHTIEVNH